MSHSAAVQQTVTSLLVSTDADNPEVWDRLVPLVYEELRALAHAQLGREAGVMLDTTELVHEAFLRLVDTTQVVGNGRSYFFGAAARAMRQVLVDSARLRRRQKRGGGALPITLRSSHLVDQPPDYDLVELDGALTCLSSVYPRAALVVECRFFGGLSVDQTAEVLGIAQRTVKRDWALARAWLHRELTAGHQ